MKISELKINPKNPRIIKDKKYRELVQSLRDFPEMMEKRPLVYDENKMILGGTQRLRALKDLGYKEIPDNWTSDASGWTEQQKREFIIKDNLSAGEHNFEMLQTDWDANELERWGLELPEESASDLKPKEVELVPYKRTHILLSFPPEKMVDIQHLLQEICAFPYIEYEQSNN